MKRIAIEGIIGWDVMAVDVRKALEEANGEEVDLLINSPGGSIFEGIAIFNAIRDFRRDGGIVAARVVGLGASMSSYIPMAADKVIVEDNAVWMIHNPWSLVAGDQNDLRAEADVLDGLSNVLAAAYEKKTGKDRQEIRGMMDKETWLYGEGIVEAGFADELVPAGEGPDTEADAMALARNAFKAMTERMKAEPDEHPLQEIAAMADLADILPAQSDREEDQAHGDLENAEGKETEMQETKPDVAAAVEPAPDVKELQAKLSAAEERMALLLQENQALTAKIAEYEATSKAAHRKAVIDAALAAGKIAPKNRERWERAYDSDPENTEALLKDKGAEIDLGIRGTSAGGGEQALDTVDQAALGRFAKAHPELSAEQAREQFLKYSR